MAKPNSSSVDNHPGAFSVLRTNRQFRALVRAQIPSDLADWLDYVAIAALLAYGWQVGVPVFALLAVALGLPYLIVGPLAGVLADRLPLKPVMVASNLGKAAVTASFALADTWQPLLVLIFVRGSFDAFFTPAKQAALQAITVPDERAAANGMSHAVNQAAKIVAPAVGGIALAVMTPQHVFLANAVVSAVAGLLLLRLSPIARPAQTSGGLGRQLTAGWREATQNPRLKIALTLMAFGFFAMFLYDTFIAPLCRDFELTQTQLGFVLAAVGGGGVAGALWATGHRMAQRPFRSVALAACMSGVLVILAGVAALIQLSAPLPVALAVAFLIGFASANAVVPIRTVVQDDTDPENIAKVAALSEAANTAAMLVAPFLGAALAMVGPLGLPFIAGGALALVNGVRAAARDRAEQSSTA